MAVAATGEAIALVGPATDAVTMVIDVGKDLADAFLGFGSSDGASDPGGENNVIVVGVGSYSGRSQDNLDGDPLVISGYFGDGKYIGTGHMPGHMNQGTPSATSLDNSGGHGDEQARKILVQQGGSDAVCISYIEVSWLQKVWTGWTGDWGRWCEQDWYYSQSTWGKKEDGSPYTPDCMWIDGNGSNGHRLQEFLIDLNYMLSNSSKGDLDTATYCTMAFSFSAETTPNHDYGIPNGLSAGAGAKHVPVRRDRVNAIPGQHHSGSMAPYPTGTKGAAPFATGTATGTAPISTSTGSLSSQDGILTMLVISDFDHHSAVELCDHPRSYGPDFISLFEEVFCDMSERRHYPLCSRNITSQCLSYDEETKKVHKRDEASRQGDRLHRTYETVNSWSKDP